MPEGDDGTSIFQYRTLNCYITVCSRTSSRDVDVYVEDYLYRT